MVTVNLRGGNAASGSFAVGMDDLLLAAQARSSRRPNMAVTASNRAACRIKAIYETRITSPGRRKAFTLR